MLLLWMACGGDAVIYLTDADNHAVTRTLDVPVESVAARSDLLFDTHAVTSDLRCRPRASLDPWLVLVKMDLEPADIVDAIERDGLLQSQQLGLLAQPLDCDTGALSEMDFFGTPADTEHELEPGYSYLLAMADGTADEWSLATVMSLAILQADADAAQDAVAMADGCGQVAMTAEIAAAGLELGRAAALDWSTLEHDALGGRLHADDVRALEVAYFSGLSAADLEAEYLTLASQVTQRWEIDVTDRTSVSMEELWALDRFDPSDGDGVWVLALRCVSCLGDIPLFLSVIR